MNEPNIQCDWGWLTSERCEAQATMLRRGAYDNARLYCEYHHRHIWTEDRCEPICRDWRPIAIFCGALAGALEAITIANGYTLADLVAAYVAADRAGDTAARDVILDLTEERGLDQPGAWPVGGCDWPEAMEHEHVWLAYIDGGPPTINALYRCPCGRFSNGYHAGRYLDGRRIVDVNRDGFGVVEKRPICTGCQSTIDPEVCHCGSPCSEHSAWDGHAPVPMGCVCHLKADPADVADLLDERAAMDDIARDAAR